MSGFFFDGGLLKRGEREKEKEEACEYMTGIDNIDACKKCPGMHACA